jgi:hypothetical protein
MNNNSYFIATNESKSELEESVIELIKNGWTPQGGLTFYTLQSGPIAWCQAMVKPMENDNE